MILDRDTHDILLSSDKLMFAPINSKLYVAPATVETINKRARGKDYCKVLACSFWPISRLSTYRKKSLSAHLFSLAGTFFAR